MSLFAFILTSNPHAKTVSCVVAACVGDGWNSVGQVCTFSLLNSQSLHQRQPFTFATAVTVIEHLCDTCTFKNMVHTHKHAHSQQTQITIVFVLTLKKFVFYHFFQVIYFLFFNKVLVWILFQQINSHCCIRPQLVLHLPLVVG